MNISGVGIAVFPGLHPGKANSGTIQRTFESGTLSTRLSRAGGASVNVCFQGYASGIMPSRASRGPYILSKSVCLPFSGLSSKPRSGSLDARMSVASFLKGPLCRTTDCPATQLAHDGLGRLAAVRFGPSE